MLFLLWSYITGALGNEYSQQTQGNLFEGNTMA